MLGPNEHITQIPIEGDGTVRINACYQVDVPTRGAAIVQGFTNNGTVWLGIGQAFKNPFEMIQYWMRQPYIRKQVAELVKYGITPNYQFMPVGSKRIFLTEGDNIKPMAAGTKILVRAADSRVWCGIGMVGGNAMLEYFPVYGNDPYGEGTEGAAQGEQLEFYMLQEGTPGERQIYHKRGPINWAFGQPTLVDVFVTDPPPRAEG